MATNQAETKLDEQATSDAADDNLYFGGDPIENEDLGSPDEINSGVDSALGLPEDSDETPDPSEQPPEKPTSTEGDGEQPPEGEGEQPPEGESEKPSEGDHKPEPRIPKSRFDQGLAKKQAQIDALQAQLDQARQSTNEDGTPQFNMPEIKDFGERGKQLFDQVLDGNTDAATNALQELLGDVARDTATAVLEQVDSRVESKARQSKAVEGYDQVVSEIEADYPFLDNSEGNDAFDADAAGEVVALRDAYMQQGQTAAEALRKAVRLASIDNGWKALSAEEEPSGGKSAEGADPGKESDAQARARAERQETAVRKNTQAAQSTPPDSPPATHQDDGLPSISKLSDDEYFALPAAQRARLRGDVI